MSTKIDYKELKRRARESMKLTRPNSWVVTLVFFLLTSGLTMALSALIPLLPGHELRYSAALFFTILMTLYSLVVKFGYRLWSLWAARRLDPGLDSLTQGFSVFLRVLSMELSIWSRTVLWSMLLCMVLLTPIFLLPDVGALLIIPFAAIIYVAVWAIMLRYAMTPYLLADRPDDGAGAAIRRSTVLMRGYKRELFKLELSFLGWHILKAALTALVLVVILWACGFMGQLFDLGFGSLPDLVVGYGLWRSDMALDFITLTQAELELISTFDTVYSSTLTTVLIELVTLPVFLWLTPYLNVARAEFYNLRLRRQMENSTNL